MFLLLLLQRQQPLQLQLQAQLLHQMIIIVHQVIIGLGAHVINVNLLVKLVMDRIVINVLLVFLATLYLVIAVQQHQFQHMQLSSFAFLVQYFYINFLAF